MESQRPTAGRVNRSDETEKEDACGECNTLYPWILGLEEADTSVQITVAGTGIEPGGAAVSWASFTWEGGSCSLVERPETSVELDITSADGSHIAECLMGKDDRHLLE